MKYELRYASHPSDAKSYDTERLRKEFLIEDLFRQNDTTMVYSLYDRLIIGGIMPVDNQVKLDIVDDLKAEFFLERREIGIVNVGGEAVIEADEETFTLGYKEMLYIGKGKRNVTFRSSAPGQTGQTLLQLSPCSQGIPEQENHKERGRRHGAWLS